MERQLILERIQSIIRETLDNEDIVINDSTVSSDVDGWDSLAQVLIIGELQNEFGVKLSSKEISEFVNVGELVDAISSRL